MFLDEKVVKKLMKEAYKTVGLRLGKSRDSMYIGGSYWEIEAKQKFLHKNVIAAIYELVGFLPEVGEWYLCRKNENQLEAIGRTIEIPKDGHAAFMTDIILLSEKGIEQRVIKSVGGSGKVFIVNNIFSAITNNKNVLEDEGEYSAGVMCIKEDYGIYQYNNVMKFHACFRTDESHETIIIGLGKMELERDEY